MENLTEQQKLESRKLHPVSPFIYRLLGKVVVSGVLAKKYNAHFTYVDDVAKYRGFSKTYVSRAVERLAGRGFLRIEPHPTDGRIQLLHITEAAAVPARRLQYTQLDLFDHLFADVSPEACAILDQIFQQLEENLDWL